MKSDAKRSNGITTDTTATDARPTPDIQAIHARAAVLRDDGDALTTLAPPTACGGRLLLGGGWPAGRRAEVAERERDALRLRLAETTVPPQWL